MKFTTPLSVSRSHPQGARSSALPTSALPRTLTCLAVLSLLLVSCPQSAPPEPIKPLPEASSLKDQQITLGYGLSRAVQQAFSGTWTIDKLPSWLTASPDHGTGSLNTVLNGVRSAAVQTQASRAALESDVKVNWTSASSAGVITTGSVVLKVSADLYQLSGRVQGIAGSLTAGRTDVNTSQSGGAVRSQNKAIPAARGVIVGYRSQAARMRAMQQRSYQQGGSVQQGGSAAASSGGLESQFRSAVGRTLALSTSDVPGTIARLKADPEVEYVVPDAVLSALDLNQPVQGQSVQAQQLQAQQVLAAPLVPSDEYAPLQWAFRLLGYPAVWRDMKQTPYVRPVTVAVLDTGVRYDHPDLKGQLYGPGDGALDLLGYVKNTAGEVVYDNGDGDGPDTDPTDPATPGRSDISHGTHVTGIIVANWGSFTPPCPTCSGSGVIGASYTAPIRVLPVRVLDAPRGEGAESDIALGVRYAAGDPVILSDGKTYTNPHPAQVINLSLGGPLSDRNQIEILCSAVLRATTLGSLVVAAGGNDGNTNPYYPAACPGAVAVASVSLSESAVPIHAFYSSEYQELALSAPGGNPQTSYNGGTLNNNPMPDEILSTGWNYAGNLPGYYLEAGTSQAAPQVTALAALLLSKGVAATPAAALDRMLATASDLGVAGRDSIYGVGLINPAAALGVAPVSNTLGLSVQDEQGHSYVPALDSVGRFTAYLPDGSFRVVAGRDSNGNGFAGETGEPRVEKTVSLGPSLPSFDVGTLTP